MSDIKVSVFKKANLPNGVTLMDISTVLNSMRTGGKLKDVILDIASTTDKKERSNKKLDNLPVICFNGEFSYRNIGSLIKHNGLIIIDIDGLEDAEARKTEICNLPYVYACFISPSYKGIKFLVRIPEINVEELGTEESDFIFKEYFKALTEDIEGIDPSGKDTSRACFFSYDPDLYVNEDAEIYTKRVKVERPENYVENIEVVNFSGNSEEWCLDKVAEIVRSSADGERHAGLLNSSTLAGGYISAGRVDGYEIESVIQSAFNERPFNERYNYKKTISDGIKNGMHRPLYRDPKYDNVKKNEDLPYTIHPQLLENNIPVDNKTVTASDLMYVPFNEFEEDAEEMFLHGNPKGSDCRFPIGRELMSYKECFSTYIYSAPFSGKTQFTMSELVFLAERYGNKIAVYSKEIGEPKDVYAEVAAIFIGKLFTHKDENLKMNAAQKDKAAEFFNKHFYVIDPMYKKQNIDVTVQAIFHCVKDIEIKEGIHINNVYIDPLSEVDEDGEDRVDRFVKKVNKAVNDDARLNNRHNFLVSHVRDQTPVFDKESGTSWFPVPTAREISGGQNSFKQGYQMLCVYRPSPNRIDKETGVEYLDNETHIYIQKAKPKGVGFTGMYKLYFDWRTNRYYQDEALTDYPEAIETTQTSMDVQPNEDPNILPF